MFSACAFALNSWADDYNFKYPANQQGQMLYFKITSDTEPYTVEVVSGGNDDYYALTSADIPASVKDNETDITYSVTSIGYYAFGGCASLESVTIQSSITSIGKYAFSGCTSLESVVIPNSVESIGDGAFGGCTSLESVTIESGTIKIGTVAFRNCTSLSQFTIDENADIIMGSSVFESCRNLVFSETTEGNCKYKSFAGNPYFRLVGVTSKDITSVEINSRCKTIDESAFYNCTNLTHITIPNGVRVIGYAAFYGCSRLETVVIPNSVKGIEDRAFIFCTSLESVVIPGSVESVSYQAFYDCTSLVTVEIQNGVKTVYAEAFRNCSLVSFSVPSSLEYLYSQYGLNIKQLTVPAYFSGDIQDIIIPAPTELLLCEAANQENCEWWSSYSNKFSSIPTIVWNYKNKEVKATAGGDAGGGTVTGGGYYTYGTQVTLTATPTDETFKFVGWNDGNHDSERVITVQDNEAEGNADANTYIASFYSNSTTTYDIVVTTKGKGSTTGGGVYLPGNKVTLTATPTNASIYDFVGWSNGTEIVSTESPYEFTPSGDVNLTAIFEGQTVEIGNNTVHAIGRITDNAVFRPTLSGLYTIAATSDNLLDTYGYLFDEEGTKLKEDDNSAGDNGQFQFDCVLDAGKTYYIGAGFYSADKEGDVIFNISQPQMIVLTAAEGSGTVVATEGTTGFVAYNSTVKLEAQPETGYHFVEWKDDAEATNPRTITITESKTYTAIFAINEYNITATGYTHGTIEGAKKYNHGQTVELTATAADGYHFEGWGDENNNNPRIFTATKDTAFTPLFAINTYTLTATGAHGWFEGIEQSYNHGATASVTAVPAEGYEFASWRDGKTANPLDTVITSNVALEAIFVVEGHTLYTITIVEPQNGTVTGDGVYEEDSTATLIATPAEGYHFVKWSDNVANYKREIVVKSDTTLAAVFEINHYTVSVAAADNGTVSGAKTYSHGDNVKIVATPDNGYHFAAWSTGETADTLKFVATKDTVFTPSFEINRYKVSGVAENGSISGLRTYNHGSEANLSAYPETGYHFVKWADGETNTNRSLIVTCDTSFKALFEINTYKATVAESEHGKVSGAGEYTHGQTASFTATADAGYQFLFWSDGGTANPRTIRMTQDVDVRAVFSLEGHSAFNVGVGTSGNGTVTGGGLYIEGETATLTAKPSSEAYHFVEWNDGNKENPRKVVVDKALNFTATFAINTYTIKASTHESEAERGTVTGGGTYTYGSTATLRATPAEGYRFTSWSDDDVYNIKFIEVKEDMTFTAHFAPAVGVDYVYVDVHDTLVVTDTLKVQEYLKEYVRDTITVEKVVEKIVRDTVTIEGTGNDTVYVHDKVYTNDTIYVHDTIYITKTDTVYLQTSARQASAVNMSVYPNPTSSFVTVNADSEFSFILTNASGKVLRKEENEQSYILDLSEYPAGIYMLTTSDGVTHKIVKK